MLGIDAAWTLSRPSGVAVAAKSRGRWRLIAAVSSYQRFQALALKQLAESRPSGSQPSAPALLSAASLLCGYPIDLVAIDMPLAHLPIIGRRISDDAVSRAYGRRKCSTHTPSASRPGRISDELRQGFDHLGYPLQTQQITSRGLIEVYPHPALVELASAPERLPYKASKVFNYWPLLGPLERRARLYRQWDDIIALLENKIAGVTKALPRLGAGLRGWEVKAYEDALDAIICVWVGVCALEGIAVPFGDEHSAIWIPTPAAGCR